MAASEEEADLYLNLSLKERRFSDFIAGESTLMLFARDAYGGMVFDSFAVIKAIHRKYAAFPPIAQILEQELMYVAENETYLPRLTNAAELILAQLHEEAYGRAPFTINAKLLCECIKRCIDRLEGASRQAEEKNDSLKVLCARYNSIKQYLAKAPSAE